jgi:hypothetical protein
MDSALSFLLIGSIPVSLFPVTVGDAVTSNFAGNFIIYASIEDPG